MKKYKLKFLSEANAIKCGKLEDIVYEKNPYDEVVSEIMNKRGVYIILSDETQFIYPKKTSKIIYIGKCDNFYRRISEHNECLVSNLNDSDRALKYLWDYDKYMYMRNHGANVYFVPVRTSKSEHKLESEIMFEFYQKYQGIPVGNKSRNLSSMYK